MIRLGTLADLAASLSNEGDREQLLAHPDYLILGPDGLAEGRTHVAERDAPRASPTAAARKPPSAPRSGWCARSVRPGHDHRA